MSRPIAVVALVLLVSGTALAALPLQLALPSAPSFPGDPISGAASSDPAVVGAWSAPFEGQVPAISMALLQDGRVLYWGGVDAHEEDNVFFLDHVHDAPSAILDTSYTAAGVTVLEPPADMRDLFCSGLTILPDGRVLTGGGSEWKNIGENNTGFVDGIADSWVFDPADSQWKRQEDMATGRWYPTLMTLADGTALAASGITHLPQPQSHNTLLERFDGVDGDWTSMEGADNLLPMYPRLFTVPAGPMKGDIFYETSGTLWGPFGEHPAEALWNLEQAYDPETNAWRYLGPSVFGARQHAATVMLPLDPADDYATRILTFGGSIGRSVASTPVAEITDLSTEPPTHAVADSLAHPRWHLNGVLLPDGTVLATGGGMYDNVYAHGQPNVPVLAAERFDPATGEWTDMAAMSVARMYHSTAILLPDARVLVGGHVPLPVPWKDVRNNIPYEEQVVETRFEIYSPPYLSWGARPTIKSAPSAVAFGASFDIASPDAAKVVDAMLVRAGATTHAWDVSQRAIVLPVTARGDGTLTFQAPPDGDVATPGPWMLFLRTQAEAGLIPSEAKFVTIGG